MKWYIATLVYRIICGNGLHMAQFDEQFRLISAADKKQAFTNARKLGEDESDSFYNDKQQLVQWQFVNVSALYCLHEHAHGAEIFSRVKEVANADAYTSHVHEKANSIHCQLH